ncbi:uncharacterized protein N7503_004608 [Penicillium pulvis]|uniref:uncharacterized protein n=1 Tax=Penicillium pulvis TaxID=1562058 RepID=UPI002548894A|nr:uncharacterized protein N7503_004608 [Penicillium pulvis]KAJ5802158.1 hypothetical protein N7503_004608 [Penicillium pulvis]
MERLPLAFIVMLYSKHINITATTHDKGALVFIVSDALEKSKASIAIYLWIEQVMSNAELFLHRMHRLIGQWNCLPIDKQLSPPTSDHGSQNKFSNALLLSKSRCPRIFSRASGERLATGPMGCDVVGARSFLDRSTPLRLISPDKTEQAFQRAIAG